MIQRDIASTIMNINVDYTPNEQTIPILNGKTISGLMHDINIINDSLTVTLNSNVWDFLVSPEEIKGAEEDD